MKYRYTKYIGDPLDEIDIEDLVSKLSDLLLSSGFGNPHGMDDAERTMQALHDAILDALLNQGMLSDEMLEKLLGDSQEPLRSPAGNGGALPFCNGCLLAPQRRILAWLVTQPEREGTIWVLFRAPPHSFGTAAECSCSSVLSASSGS